MAFRGFREEDYEAVCTFLTELNQNNRAQIHWNWARFEWMYAHPDFDKNLISSIGLWWEGARIVGAAIYDMYFGEAFCGVLPGREDLYPQVLRYAWEALRDENGLGIALCDTSAAEIAAAQRQGFARAEQTETLLRLDLQRDLSYALPEGLHLEVLDPVEQTYAFKWLLWQGFDHGDDRAEFERTESVEPPLRRHLNPELSLAAVNSEGEPVACCCVWYRPGTDYAYVEPVCTVPAYRRKGAAKAALLEALRRANALGAKAAYVISDQAFYRRLGFENAYHYTFYWKRA